MGSTLFDIWKAALGKIKENEQKVYEAGKEAEWYAFWNTYQNSGKKQNYTQAIYSARWTDANYKPVFPFICSVCTSMYNSAYISDTLVDIDISDCTSASNLFSYCGKLKNIKKLITSEQVTYKDAFVNCSALEHITFEGVIGQNLNMSACPLDRESTDNIFDHLKDFTEWTESSGFWGMGTTVKYAKIMLNEDVENKTDYEVKATKDNNEQSGDSFYQFDAKGVCIVPISASENTMLEVVEVGASYNSLSRDQYTIYEGVLNSSTKALTLKADAVSKAYNTLEWESKVVEANCKGWTVEKA